MAERWCRRQGQEGDATYSTLVIETENGEEVARLSGPALYGTKCRRARLIAAAPLMLEALRALLNTKEIGVYYGAEADAIQAASAAIAAAEREGE